MTINSYREALGMPPHAQPYVCTNCTHSWAAHTKTRELDDTGEYHEYRACRATVILSNYSYPCDCKVRADE